MTEQHANRRAWLSLLARCDHSQLLALWSELALAPDYTTLRAPEIGGVMVRGRAGAVGAAFNLGEMTVTRASVQIGDAVGHGYVQGRSKDAALVAAQVDALMQGENGAIVEAELLSRLRAAHAATATARAEKAAATKVDFFTMARGED